MKTTEGKSGVIALDEKDERNEILYFSDGSKIEIDRSMRSSNPETYLHATKYAVKRLFPPTTLVEPERGTKR